MSPDALTPKDHPLDDPLSLSVTLVPGVFRIGVGCTVIDRLCQ